MVSNPTCNWTGASERNYMYYVWKLPVCFEENQNGNYIYSKKNSEDNWVPIYIGQGDLKDRTENHHQAVCIARKEATHIHAHLNSNEKDRLDEEKDLLANYTNAYQPTGCNEKKGG